MRLREYAVTIAWDAVESNEFSYIWVNDVGRVVISLDDSPAIWLARTLVFSVNTVDGVASGFSLAVIRSLMDFGTANALLGDLEESFDKRCASAGFPRALVWHWCSVAASAGHLIWGRVRQSMGGVVTGGSSWTVRRRMRGSE